MRLLAVADLHYSLPQFDWVLEVAPDFDVVVLAGDLLELSSIVDRRAQAVVVRKYFDRLRAVTRLVTCSGNHVSTRRTRAAKRSPNGSGKSKTRASPPTASPSCSTEAFSSPSVRGGTDRSRGQGSRRSLPRRRRPSGNSGFGSTMRRPTNRQSAGAARAISAIPSSRNGSSSTGPTSCCAGTCISHPS